MRLYISFGEFLQGESFDLFNLLWTKVDDDNFGFRVLVKGEADEFFGGDEAPDATEKHAWFIGLKG